MAGSLWRQEIGSDRRGRADARSGLRLSARLVARRSPHRLRASSRQRDRAVAARSVVRHGAAAHDDECSEPRAALLARRQAARLRVDRRQRSLQSVRRADRRRQARRSARRGRAARERDRALLLFEARSHDQSVVDAGRQTTRVRLQSRDRLRQRRPVQRRGRWRERASNASCTRRPVGARSRKSRPTAGACCTAAIRDVSGISCG